ncbi:MAG: GNAT family N-acetyltransferase, partial [Verrucomicrobiales bacterium]|nr:GNAT family N-acetyltransferase [Verrucomicrobiales bacterium]
MIEQPRLDHQLVDPLADRDWDHAVMGHPECTVFHTAAWARVLVRTYAHKPTYLRFSRNGELAAMVPLMEVRSLFTGRRGVCMPFSDFCHPLFAETHSGSDSRAQIVRNLTELARERRWKHLELRGGVAPELASPSGSFYTHRLDLTQGGEPIEARFSNSVRRAIRKAERGGLRVRISRSEGSLLDFYRLHMRTRRRHGLPPQPVSFFKAIYEELISPGLGFVVIAEKEKRSRTGSADDPIAAAVFLQVADSAIYKFGASDERLWQLRANNLVMFRAIQFLAASGAKTLDFGRTALDSPGLRRFKLSWGTEEKVIH